MLIPKENYVRSEKHRKFIASLPCCITGVYGSTQAAHLRKGNGGGMGIKPSDEFCVPLHFQKHAEQGQMGEELFWAKYGHTIEEVREFAKDLYSARTIDLALKLIQAFRGF